MTTSIAPDPGFLAVTRASLPPDDEHLRSVAQGLGIGSTVSFRRSGSIELIWWGFDGDPAESCMLCRGARWRDGFATPERVQTMLRNRSAELADALPPFAAVAQFDDSVTVATDFVGARHVYLRDGPGWSAMSTSVQSLAALAPTSLDREAVAVQSLLGWQLGSRTIYRGIGKVPAGHIATLANGRSTVEPYHDGAATEQLDLAVAVRRAAATLRGYLNSYLDERPDATLQLSGGWDSRVLLSAIPPSRRRGLAAMTLQTAGSQDATIATQLAERERLDHRLIAMDGLQDVASDVAHEMCTNASRRLSYMASPLAFAALSFVDPPTESGPRISGVGGEVARGFYYADPVVTMPVTRMMSAALARWRLFANEAVPNAALAAEFGNWAREVTIREVYDALAGTGRSWWSATDDFFLFQRVQRWAGVISTAGCFDRESVNPMLDRRFIDLVRALRPRDKNRARFLSLLQAELDEDLARIPLDSRPAPVAFSGRGLAERWTRTSFTFGKTVRKVNQRLRRSGKAQAGAPSLAAGVTAHWRRHPDTLDALAGVDVFDRSWLEAVLEGTVDPGPSTVAFVLNVAAAADDAARLTRPAN